jgi:hypothetical protein
MSRLDSIREGLRREAPLIMSTAAVAGFLVATYSAIKATPRANEELAAYGEFEALEPKQRILDKAKILMPIYAPAIGYTLISIALIIGTNDIYRKRSAAVSVALFSANSALRRWESVVANQVTAKKLDEIKAEVDTPRRNPPESIILSSSTTIVYDVFSDRYFEVTSVDRIHSAVNEINRRIRANDFVPVNDLYFAIGLNPLPYGDEIGWCVEEGPMEIRISATLIKDSQTPCVSISFETEPRYR